MDIVPWLCNFTPLKLEVMLYTNLRHIENHGEYLRAIHDNENVMIICGRMDPASIQAYSAAEALAKDYSDVAFFDIEFDNPYSQFLLASPEIGNSSGIPFLVCVKNEHIISVKDGLITKAEISAILESEFSNLYQYHRPWPAQT